MNRLGRSMLNMITLGADLRERGIGLKVLEQGIDTATAEGHAMFGMLPVLAEVQRKLIVANTRDGLAAVRPRDSMTTHRRPDHRHAGSAAHQRLWSSEQATRGHTGQDHPGRRAPAPTSRTGPTCGHDPTTHAEAAHQRMDLTVTWLHPDPDHRGKVISRHHCRHSEPGSAMSAESNRPNDRCGPRTYRGAT
ncbi:recombinase family protein [Rhodococcus sp. USK10]|uniref:recombinase family protein n=1 Tax=Rhodococcus sp. USK10 TaxID=2789739 RepID=UPI0027E56DCB|nr:recombinase family protein [Rhodococcus sp. USK10]